MAGIRASTELASRSTAPTRPPRPPDHRPPHGARSRAPSVPSSRYGGDRPPLRDAPRARR
jgi:hypothetical protein